MRAFLVAYLSVVGGAAAVTALVWLAIRLDVLIQVLLVIVVLVVAAILVLYATNYKNLIHKGRKKQ